ncbi:MAG: hypothetical protein AB7K24_10950, partial [Gemmataceae bacterium]
MNTKETAAELQAAAQAMEAAARRGRAVLPVLKNRCPYVARQIARDARCPRLFALWGRCVNVDENVGQTIVHPAILSAIGSLAGVTMRGRLVHAGLQHTYGYLFSLIDTPYGAKRDRWISTDMEHAFGLEASLLGAQPRNGTLLANLTYFLGKLVLPARRLEPLEDMRGAVARDLRNFDPRGIDVQQIIEQVRLKEGRQLTLCTDLVAYPQRHDGVNETALLIYSVRIDARPVRLITAFPVTAAAAAALIADVPASGRG